MEGTKGVDIEKGGAECTRGEASESGHGMVDAAGKAADEIGDANGTTTLTQLPPEMLHWIAHFLSPADRMSMALLCRATRWFAGGRLKIDRDGASKRVCVGLLPPPTERVIVGQHGPIKTLYIRQRSGSLMNAAGITCLWASDCSTRTHHAMFAFCTASYPEAFAHLRAIQISPRPSLRVTEAGPLHPMSQCGRPPASHCAWDGYLIRMPFGLGFDLAEVRRMVKGRPAHACPEMRVGSSTRICGMWLNTLWRPKAELDGNVPPEDVFLIESEFSPGLKRILKLLQNRIFALRMRYRAIAASRHDSKQRGWNDGDAGPIRERK